MANEKNISARIIHKHDTEANWGKATNFIPKQAEIIIYDPDTNFNYPRIKIGDGTTNIKSLKFIIDENIEKYYKPKHEKISLYSDNWEDTDSEQIFVQEITDSTLNGKITECSKIDLQPTPEQLAIFHENGVAFTAVNEDGRIFVYAIGIKPTQDYTDLQITITEVMINA